MSVLESNLATGLSHDLAAIFGRVYRVNGWQRMSVWDGYNSVAVQAGLYQPPFYSTVAKSAVLTTTTGMDPGAHFFRYRYMDSRTQYVGNPSEAIPFSATRGAADTGAKYTFSNIIASPDTKVDRIVAEVTDAGGTQFFRGTAVANANQSIPIQMNDDELRAVILDHDDFGHDKPPFFRHVEAFKGRLWGFGQHVYDAGTASKPGAGRSVVGAGTQWTSAAVGRLMHLSGKTRAFIGSVVSNKLLLLEEAAASATSRNYRITDSTPDVLYFSKPLYPESWPPENRFRVLDGRPEKIRAAKGYRNDLVIFGERSMERLVFGENPHVDGTLEPIPGERGVASRLCTVDAAGHLWALDYKGIHRYAGSSPEHASEQIDPLFDPGDRTRGYVDFQYRELFHAVHFPQRHQIVWFVVVNGLPGDETVYTTTKHAIVYDYLNDSFGLWKFDVAMVASTIGPGSDGTTQTLVADENGRLWVLGIGTADGVHSSSARTLTVGSGTTASTVSFSAGATLYASGDGLAGATVYSPDLDEVRVIDSNLASSLRLSSPFTSSPSVGATLYLGRIPAKWKSKAFVPSVPGELWDETRYLTIGFEPKDSGTVRVRFYINRDEDAYGDYVQTQVLGSASQDPDENYWVVDVTQARGTARIPIPCDGPVHAVEVEIESVSAVPFEMDALQIDGMAAEEDYGDD